MRSPRFSGSDVDHFASVGGVAEHFPAAVAAADEKVVRFAADFGQINNYNPVTAADVINKFRSDQRRLEKEFTQGILKSCPKYFHNKIVGNLA